jgi:hypothetical protein
MKQVKNKEESGLQTTLPGLTGYCSNRHEDKTIGVGTIFFCILS